MTIATVEGFETSRLKAVLKHFSAIDDPCEPWRGTAHLDFLRRYLPYDHGVPGGRWLTILMNRIEPALFSVAFTEWVREPRQLAGLWLNNRAKTHISRAGDENERYWSSGAGSRFRILPRTIRRSETTFFSGPSPPQARDLQGTAFRRSPIGINVRSDVRTDC